MGRSPLLDESRARQTSKAPQHRRAALFISFVARPLSRSVHHVFYVAKPSQDSSDSRSSARSIRQRRSAVLVVRTSGRDCAGDSGQLVG